MAKLALPWVFFVSCVFVPPKTEHCKRLYDKCEEISKTWVEYLDCRELVDRGCLYEVGHDPVSSAR